jgi:uncharacterized membrane protein (UPF0136 family)
MDQIAIWTILVYASLVALGGVVGYLKAKSKISLISGLLGGSALLATWFLATTQTTIGLGIAALISAILLVTFIVRFVRTRKWMPAGMMMFLSLATTVVFAVAWLG